MKSPSKVFSIAETMGAAVIWMDSSWFLFRLVLLAFCDPISTLARSVTIIFSWMYRALLLSGKTCTAQPAALTCSKPAFQSGLSVITMRQTTPRRAAAASAAMTLVSPSSSLVKSSVFLAVPMSATICCCDPGDHIRPVAPTAFPECWGLAQSAANVPVIAFTCAGLVVKSRHPGSRGSSGRSGLRYRSTTGPRRW